jgi:competence protein ComEA
MGWRALLVCLLAGLATPASASAPADEGTTPPAPAPVVDLNTASVQELCTLPGIGPKKAEAIISLREKRPFTRVTQLLLVKGIGPKTLTRLKPRLVVGPARAEAGPVPTVPTEGGP